MSGVWSSRSVVVTLVSLVVSLMACAGGKKSTESAGGEGASAPLSSGSRLVSGVKIESPKRNTTISTGKTLRVEWSDSYAQRTDSLQLIYDNRLVKTFTLGDSLYDIVVDKGVGVRNVKVQAFYADGNTSVAVIPITVLPDAPKRLTYKVLATRKHDKGSFTQGLYYKDGFLYEGTGQYGASALMKVEPSTGKIVTSIALKDSYFGEGIAELGGEIFQLTWMNGLCLVYDAKTMSYSKEYAYGSQGWGLTTDGKELIMSDGSNKLTILDPRNFQPLRQIQVYDNQGAVEQLNELEYVDGLVWANVWQSDRIVAISMESGAVVADLDLSKLLSDADRRGLDTIDHVLNGIAWDKERNVFFVTGKCWPKLFEIHINR